MTVRMDDGALRQLVDDAKSRTRLSDVIGRHTKLKKRGAREMVGLCPVHNERSPSLEVNDTKGQFHCHGCGWSGDHLTALMRLDGMRFREACETLTGDMFPAVDPAAKAKAAEEDRATHLQAISDARTIWNASVDPHRTIAETYLREVRGITMRLPAAVRFGRVPTGRDEFGRWKAPQPAVVFACTDLAGEVVGVQRVFLRDDGIGKRWGKRSKLSLGRPKGAAVKLSCSDSATTAELIICEGPEDGLTLAQELPDVPVWVALGTDMMPGIRYPASVQRVTIAGQNDAPGRAAVKRAAEALVLQGLEVRTMFPAEGHKDFNDQLRGVSA